MSSLTLSKYNIARKSLGTTVLPPLYLTGIVFLSSTVQDGVVVITQMWLLVKVEPFWRFSSTVIDKHLFIIYYMSSTIGKFLRYHHQAS